MLRFSRRVVLRVTIAAALVAMLLGATAAPASAHTISGPRPTNFRSRVISITPPIPGVTVRMVDLGTKVELTNTGSQDVIVEGYEGEPYLRVGPGGVYRNVHSAATYINSSLKGGVVPSGVDTSPELAPEWRKIGDGRTVRWHDHRTHWMGVGLPQQVAAAPDKFAHISYGRITLEQNGRESVAVVSLDWVPGPSGWPWMPVAVAAFALALIAALYRSWWRVLAVIIVLLVLADASHAISYELARPGGGLARTGQFAGGNFVSIIVWIAAVPTVIGLWRRRVEALYGAIFVGLMVALVGGATDLSTLWKSQLPSIGPDWLTRLQVAFALGAGAGVVAGCLIRLIAREHTPRAPDPETAGKWLATLVVGLDERELRRIAADLDVDEVLDAALHDLATRLPVSALASGSLVFDVVADDDSTHVWSIAASGDTLEARRDRVDPVAVELGVAFPLLLQLLAGTVAIPDAVTAGRVRVTGDHTVLDNLAPDVPEIRRTPAAATAASSPPRDDDRAPAS